MGCAIGAEGRGVRLGVGEDRGRTSVVKGKVHDRLLLVVHDQIRGYRPSKRRQSGPRSLALPALELEVPVAETFVWTRIGSTENFSGSDELPAIVEPAAARL